MSILWPLSSSLSFASRVMAFALANSNLVFAIFCRGLPFLSQTLSIIHLKSWPCALTTLIALVLLESQHVFNLLLSFS